MSTNFFINWITPSGRILEAFEEDHVIYDFEIKTNIPGTPVFEIVSGVAPTTLYSNGRLEGKLSNVNGDTPFLFTIRVKVGNNPLFSDRTFEILVKKIKKPPLWLVKENDLGEIGQNDFINLSLDLVPNSTNPISFQTINLPSGLSLQGNNIIGYFSPTNQGGEGSFEVVASNEWGSSKIIFYYNFKKQRGLPFWITPQNLGTFVQGQNVNIQLFATNNLNEEMKYKTPYGHGAKIIPLLNEDGQIIGSTVIDPGKDWATNPIPNVKFYMGSGAQFTANISGGVVTSITINNKGSNYKSAPDIEITGGGGSGANYVAEMKNGRIENLQMISGGSGYVSPPTVTAKTFTTQGVALPIILEGEVVGLNIINQGSGYLYPPTVLVESPDPPIGGGSLPLGLELTEDGFIRGSISMEAEPRLYSFLVVARDPVGQEVSRVFQLQVDPFDASSISNILIFWLSDEYLGSIYERYPSYFFVEAVSSTGDPLEYSLAPGSNPLPPGLSISKYTGDLLGWVDKIPSTTDYTFTIRASVVGNPNAFSDKVFKIRVVKRFQYQNTQNYWLRYTGFDKIKMLEKKLESNNILGLLYRKTNKDFGFVLDKRILIAGGVKEKTKNEIWNLIKKKIPGNNYSSFHNIGEFVIGNLAFRRVLNPEGVHICDGVFCILYDNREIQGKRFYGPGGWTPQNNIEFVVLNNSNHPYNQMLPSSIGNIRKEIRETFGFAEKEFIPWAILQGERYNLILEIAYVKKNQGFVFIQNFIDFWNSEFLGNTIILDRYYVTDWMNNYIEIFPFDLDPHHSGY